MTNQNSRIGALAERAGVSPDALRYYERRGLLKPPLRTEGGFRLYDETARTRVEFIKRAQGVGFTLDEIRELVTFDQRGLDRCRRVHVLIQVKLAQIERHMADLRTLKRSLLGSLQSCEDKVMTYNVQLANFGAPNPDSRKAMIIEIIRSEAPDIVGLQELGSTHRVDIEAGLQDLSTTSTMAGP